MLTVRVGIVAATTVWHMLNNCVIIYIMKKTFEKVGKVLAAGLAAGIGITACGEAKPSSSSVEVRIQSQIDGLSTSNTSFVGSTAVNIGAIEKNWVSVLPNDTQIELQVTYPTKTNAKGLPTNKYSTSAVEGIDVTFYNPGADLKNTKPEAAYDLGKEVNGRWEATYYQYVSSSSEFSISEKNQTTVETQASPGSIPLKVTTSPAEARSIYKQVVGEVETTIDHISNDNNIAINPNAVQI